MNFAYNSHTCNCELYTGYMKDEKMCFRTSKFSGNVDGRIHQMPSVSSSRGRLRGDENIKPHPSD